MEFCIETELWEIDRIIPYENNPKKHFDAFIFESMAQFKCDQPIVIDGGGVVIKGHGRLKQLRAAGVREVPVIVRRDLTEAQVRASRIADNRSAEGGWDVDKLLGEIAEIKEEKEVDYEALGLTEDWFGALQNEQVEVESEGEETEIIMEPEISYARQGEVWQLGAHRLLCGDCTKKEDVEKLFEGGKANMMLTDPPYGVDYASKNSFLNKCDHGARIQREIKNDKNKNYKLFFVEFMNIVPFTVYNTIYVFIGRSQIEDFLAAMRESGITISVFLVWVKNTFVLGRADYHSKFEFVLYGWKGKHRFYGGQNKTTVLQEAKPTASTLHPTMKPVSLLMELINDGSRNGDGVYDPFGGSGSTLIACERMNRVCYTIEIEPYYCDVIIQRFKKFTGQEPICLA